VQDRGERETSIGDKMKDKKGEREVRRYMVDT
jgi:hypothetical protein